MTTTTADATAAAEILQTLRQDTEQNLVQLRQRLLNLVATGISEAEQFRVLRADCGMLITQDGETYRLTGWGEGMRRAFLASQYEARAVADHWNARLTREQMVARCWVEVLPIGRALEIAIDEAEALLERLPA